MPPKKAIAAQSAPLKSASGRQRTLTNKQQQIIAQQNEKEGAAKQRALTDAIRAEQRLEEMNGFHKAKLPEVPADDEDDLDPESEDNPNDEIETPHTVFSSVTIPPIIKTVKRHGRTLVYRVPDTSMDQEMIPSATPAQSHASAIPASKKPKGLVRRVTGDSRSSVSSAYPSMSSHVLEDEEADVPDTVTHHHDSPEPSNRKRKENPATTSTETTVVTKSLKVEGSGSRGRVRAADFSELTRSIIEETISIYRAQIGSVEPFPERTDDRDIVKQAWIEVCTGRSLRVEIEEDIFKFIVARASQTRGYAKTLSKPYFILAYSIDGLGSKREVRDRVEQLLDGARFIYKDPVSKTGIFRGPLIQTLINKIWFKNKEDDGVIHPEFSENDMLPMPTVAFVMTVIENNLDEWVTGEHIDVPFTATAYRAKYRAHLKLIMDFDKKTHEAAIIPRLLKHLLKMARKHAKVSGEGNPQPSSITDAEIEAAKQEWADLVLSDDD